MKKNIFILFYLVSASLLFADASPFANTNDATNNFQTKGKTSFVANDIEKSKDLSQILYEDLVKSAYKYFIANDYNKSRKFFQEMLKRQLSAKNLNNEELGTIYFALGRIAIIQKDREAPGFLSKSANAFKNSKDYSLRANIDLLCV